MRSNIKKVSFAVVVYFILTTYFFGLVSVAYATNCPDGSVCTGGSGNWTAPAGVIAVQAEVWGAGGAGAGETINGDGGESGGGGGAYSKTTNIAVVSGNSYAVGIGAK